MSKSRRQYQNILANMTAAMIESVSLDSWFDFLTGCLKQEMSLGECLIVPSGSQTNKIQSGCSPSLVSESYYLVNYYNKNLRKGQPALLSNLLEIESTGLQLNRKQKHWQSLGIFPIFYQQSYWGAIALFYLEDQRKWQENELAYIKIITDQCAIAIHLHLLQEEKQKVENLNQKIVGGLDYTFHECRQPLSAILGLARMLNEEIYGSLNKKQLEYVQAIIASGEHLLALTNNFLDLSKIEAQKEELFLEKTLIQEVCEASISIVQESATRKHISLILDIEAGISFCVADSMRLKQILVNLLSNGIKYAEDGTVSLKVTQSDQGFFFAIRDSGIGISQENQQKLFQPFSQIPNTYNRRQKGTGLGLVLSRHLARLHGGDLTLESEPGKGSCFTLYIPLVPKTELS